MGSGGRFRPGAPLVAGLLTLTIGLAGCGSFGGDSGGATAAPESATLRVGVGNPIESAPLRIAVADGTFTRAGLRVELVEQTNVTQALDQLSSGRLDIAFGSDVQLFRAAANGTPLQLQGEAYTAGPGTMALVTLPDSGYTEPAAKKAPTVAVDTLDGLGALTTRSTLATAGVDPARIKFTQRPADGLIGALRDGDADAAWLVEPAITIAQQDFGARVLADTARGATLEFPVSAYAASRSYAESHPRTLELFRELLGQAQSRAAEPAAVRVALPNFAGIDTNTASLVSLGTYPSSLSGVRLQRVADLMHGAGLLSGRLDVQALLPQAELG